MSAVVDARPSVLLPVTSKTPETERLVVDALVNVVFPVTSKVDEKSPVVPTSAP